MKFTGKLVKDPWLRAATWNPFSAFFGIPLVFLIMSSYRRPNRAIWCIKSPLDSGCWQISFLQRLVNERVRPCNHTQKCSSTNCSSYGKISFCYEYWRLPSLTVPPRYENWRKLTHKARLSVLIRRLHVRANDYCMRVRRVNSCAACHWMPVDQ